MFNNRERVYKLNDYPKSYLRWIFTLIVFNTLFNIVHAGYITWIMATYLGIDLFRGSHYKQSVKENVAKNLSALVCTGLIYIEYGTFLSLNSAASLIIYTILLKARFAKSKSQRQNAIIMSLLLPLITALRDQTVENTVICTVSIFIIFLTLLINCAPSPQMTLKGVFKNNLPFMAKTFFISLPLAGLLFFVFPRSKTTFAPLGGNQTGDLGFNNKISPGDLARINQSDKPAFKAIFYSPNPTLQESTIPAMSERYFRGAVLDVSNGLTWKKSKTVSNSSPPPAPFYHLTNHYRVILEPRFGKWIFALESPTSIWFTDPKKQRDLLNTNHQVYSLKEEATTRLVYYGQFASSSKKVEESDLSDFLKLNFKTSESIESLVQDIQINTESNTKIYEKIIDYYKRSNFTYSLSPGQLKEENRLAEFLFKTKVGYCEHYAGATATLLRMAGVPARVVVGFLGGEFNSFDNSLSLTDADAHAWLEYYEPTKREWIRADPTAYISPARLDLGGQAFLASFAGDIAQTLSRFTSEYLSKRNSILWNMKLFYESIENRWNLFLLDFDLETQLKIIQRLSIEHYAGLYIITTLLLTIYILTKIVKILSKKPQRNKHEVFLTDFRQLKNHLKQLGLPVSPATDAIRLKEMIIDLEDGAHDRPPVTDEAKTSLIKYLDILSAILYESQSIEKNTGKHMAKWVKNLKKQIPTDKSKA